MKTFEQKKPCPRCNGRKTESYLDTETDTAMSVAMGASLGMGFFPMTRTVTKTRDCSWCHGSGEQR